MDKVKSDLGLQRAGKLDPGQKLNSYLFNNNIDQSYMDQAEDLVSFVDENA